jgi:hypothetical protein
MEFKFLLDEISYICLCIKQPYLPYVYMHVVYMFNHISYVIYNMAMI